jgi:hypothetical protein
MDPLLKHPKKKLSVDALRKTPASSDSFPLSDPQISKREAREARLAYIRSVVPPAKHKRKWPRYVALLILVICIGSLGFLVATHVHFSPQTDTANKQTQQALVRPVVTVSSTKQYMASGNDLNLSFSFPSNWMVAPSSGSDSTDQPITATSPVQTITNSKGVAVSARVIVSIRPGSDVIGELSSGSVIAALNSVQFTYDQPATGQDATPYLSFLDTNGGSDSAAAFQEVLVTGSTSYAQGESMTTSNVMVDPIISASFYNCSNLKCNTSQLPVSVSYASWQNSPVLQQTLSLFKSLAIN